MSLFTRKRPAVIDRRHRQINLLEGLRKVSTQPVRAYRWE